MLRKGRRLVRGLALVGLPGCGLLGTEPSPTALPLITSLSLDFVVNHGRESVRIWFTPTAATFPNGAIPAGRSVVEVRTTSGDEEEALLLLFVCRDQRGSQYFCNQFTVGLPEGTTEADLLPLLAPISGRLMQLIRNGASAAVFVTQGNFFDAMQKAGSWPGVRWVNLNHVFFPSSIGGPEDDSQQSVLKLFPLASGPPVRYDGEVQIQPGDTITVSYDGGGPELVEAHIVVP